MASYTIAQSAVKIMAVNNLSITDLDLPPANGKSYTKQDIREYLERKSRAATREEVNNDTFSAEILEIIEESKENIKEALKDVGSPESITSAPTISILDEDPPILEFFWKDRDQANALVAQKRYTIVESVTIKNGPQGLHKKLILKKL